jgi:membrane-associated phospholipid phosphatase
MPTKRISTMVNEERKKPLHEWLRLDVDSWWVDSYYQDWAMCVLLFAYGLVVHHYKADLIFQRPGPCDVKGQCQWDSNGLVAGGESGWLHSFAIDKPWGGESTVKMQYLLILLVLIPILTVIAIQQCFVRSMHDFHHFFLALFVGHAYNYSMCETLKVAGGRLRPDFIARMKMNGGWNDMSNSDVLDGHLSWPSGHSSMAAIGATVFTLYLAGKLGAFQASGGHTWKVLLCFVTQWICWAVMVSRTWDNRHNFSDILTGYLLGLGLGGTAYFQFFHPLSSPLSFWPKSREAELMKKIPGYRPGDQTLRMQVYASVAGGCLAPHLEDMRVQAANLCTEAAVKRALELAASENNARAMENLENVRTRALESDVPAVQIAGATVVA